MPTNFQKAKRRVKTANGWSDPISYATSSESVELTDGTDLQTKINSLGTASTKDVATSGNASTTQVVMGNDTRLSDSRPASDVSAWAKASTKPTYTASEVGTYTSTEIDNKFSTLETNIDWKEAVATYSDIATTYPNPVDGWTVNVKDTDYTYRYNGISWVAISANAIPEATTNVNGLMTTTQVTKLDGIEAQANKTVVDSTLSTTSTNPVQNKVITGEIDNITSFFEKRTAKIYGFHISSTESDPAAKVTYLADAVGMTPAHMNFTSGTFDYGSWEDVWFVRDTKPCLLKDNGQIHRYLNKNNFLKDIDGNDTGVPQITIHTMIEFPKIWYKVVPDIDGKGASIYISPVKVDADYVDYPYIDYQGIHKEHFYMPAYNGSTQTESGTTYLCSTYGETVSKNLTAEQEIAYCKAHGNGWNTEDAGSIMLINFLLILMGKSTDVQSVFGQGLHTSGTEAINNGFTTGIHYNKGMFYGTNSGTIASNNYSNTVKVFGIENYWGFQWRRYAGDILVDGTRKIKLCYGNEDGSSTFDYNLTGEGYIDIGATPSGTSGGYISEMKFTKTGMYGKVSSGSSTTHYCDGQWYNNSGTIYAFRGGTSHNGAPVGAFCVSLNRPASIAGWILGAAPSYK